MGELSGSSIILFALFAIVLIAMYIIVRRGMAPVGPVALVGTIVNIILAALVAISADNHPAQVIFVGLVVGGLFSIASVTMAAYFRSNDVDYAAMKQAMSDDAPNSTDEG
jgi:hypothetical protein